MRGRLSELAGAVAVGVGFVVLGDRDLAGLVTLNRSLLLALAVLSFVLGLRAARERRGLDRRLADTDDVERRYEAPRPGAALDERFAGATGLSGLSRRRRSDLRERVADAAVAALTGAGLSESAARERVDAGAWTADPLAAWFLSPELGLPLSTRLRTLVGGSRYRAGAARAVEAVERLQTGETDAADVVRGDESAEAGTDEAGRPSVERSGEGDRGDERDDRSDRRPGGRDDGGVRA